MTKQKFGTKLSGRDRLTETCCAEKHWLLKTENQRKYACLRTREIVFAEIEHSAANLVCDIPLKSRASLIMSLN